jgi:hypothetical protein
MNSPDRDPYLPSPTPRLSVDSVERFILPGNSSEANENPTAVAASCSGGSDQAEVVSDSILQEDIVQDVCSSSIP